MFDGDWRLARRLLHDEGIDPRDRVAGLLVVLYAQSVTGIARLRADDVASDGGVVRLRLGTTPLRLPAPLTDHVLALVSPRVASSAAKLAGATQWLFPGQHPGRPIHATVVAARLRALGMRVSTRRTTALAHLAASAPRCHCDRSPRHQRADRGQVVGSQRSRSR